MTELNLQALRGILAQVTSVDPAYIVPKQGTWWNPQEQAGKPDTWCAFMIRRTRPRTAGFYYAEGRQGGTENCASVEKISIIDLQFVGPQAEAIASSVSHWPMRADVAEAFKSVRGVVLNTVSEAVSSSFYQDGVNNVVAWNISIEVLWYHLIDTNQDRMPVVTFLPKEL